jgi:hypothetical protein
MNKLELLIMVSIFGASWLIAFLVRVRICPEAPTKESLGFAFAIALVIVLILLINFLGRSF